MVVGGSYDVRLRLARCDPFEFIRRLEFGSTSFDHLFDGPVRYDKVRTLDITYILTFLSSPPDANMHGSAGFQATAFTHPLE